MPDVITEPFGRLDDGQEVHRLILIAGGYSAAITTLGATLQSLTSPDRDGKSAEIVLGFPDPQSQLGAGRYFGASIGRVANRIAGGRFTLNGRDYQIPINDGPNALHGGLEGFDARLWEVVSRTSDDTAAEVTLTLQSPDGDQGFPARLRATVGYRLSDHGRLTMTFTASNLEPPGGLDTVVNLCNHAYFNLDGVGTGSIDRHLLRIPGTRITEVDQVRIPTGAYQDVSGTPLDFRTLTTIGPAIRDPHPFVAIPRGLDHNWVIDEDAPRHPELGELRLGAELISPATGRRLTMWTDRPGMQAFTANQIDGYTHGSSGLQYRQGDGLALETQLFPGTPTFAHFPTAVLAAGQSNVSVTVVELGTVS